MKQKSVLITAGEVAEVLQVSRNKSYQIINDLKNTMAEAGIEDILIKSSTTYAIDVDKVSCDYFDFLSTGKPYFRISRSCFIASS